MKRLSKIGATLTANPAMTAKAVMAPWFPDMWRKAVIIDEGLNTLRALGFEADEARRLFGHACSLWPAWDHVKIMDWLIRQAEITECWLPTSWEQAMRDLEEYRGL